MLRQKLIENSKKQIEMSRITNKLLDEEEKLRQCANYEKYEDLLNEGIDMSLLEEELAGLSDETIEKRRLEGMDHIPAEPDEEKWKQSQEGLDALHQLAEWDEAEEPIITQKKVDNRTGEEVNYVLEEPETSGGRRKRIRKQKSHKRIRKQSHKKYTSKRKHIHKRTHRRKH